MPDADSADLQQAIDQYAAGDRPAARTICGEILRRNPCHAGTAWLLGVLALDDNRTAEAMLHFQHAVAREPGDARFHNGLGEAYRALGRWSDATACLTQAVALDPHLAAAWHSLGLIQLETNDIGGAIENLRRATALRPEYARGHLNLGRALQLHGDLRAATASYREAIRLDRRYAIAHNNLGAALHVQNQSHEAVVCLRRALALNPDYPEAHYNLGNALQAIYEPSAALECYLAALKLRPGYVNAQYQLGLVLEKLGRREEAVRVYEEILGSHNDHGEAWQRLGVMHMLRRMWDPARAAFERAATCSASPEQLSPDLVHARQMLCDWSTLERDREKLWTQAAARLQGETGGPILTESVPAPGSVAGQTAGIPPFHSLVLGWPADRQLAVARAEARSLADRHEKLQGELQLRNRAGGTGERLRIGYLSGDFYDHAVSHQAQGLFGLHDRRKYEIFTYSYAPDDASSYRRRIQADSEHYVDVSPLSVKDLALTIANDGIQILVDMMGYIGFSRLEVMALRPAPVQASWLSYPGTTGADFIDYLIGDRVVTPTERAADFSEKLVIMPHSYMVTDHEQSISNEAVRRSDYGLPDGGVVFCSLNNSYKFEPRMFNVWMRILAQVPDSVLWLLTGGATMEANLRREAQARDVDPKRLVFARGYVPKALHLARLRLADLFLDTYFYNAHVTGCDALWAGLPVLTCPGQAFAARVAASLLSAVGLPELIASDLDRYEQLAVRLSCHPDELHGLRAKLADHRTTWPLFDTPRFVRNLERAFDAMWEIHQAGQPPRSIEIVEA